MHLPGRDEHRRTGGRRLRLIAVSIAVVSTAACSLPPIDLANEKPLPLRTTILAADGTFLARLYRENRVLAQPEEIPQVLKDAVLAAEDSRFFQHGGYDVRSIARAALVNIEEGEVVQGGSTITQQYVKNTYFRQPARTFERKARELRLAIEVERRYTKEEILTRYLNTVYLGSGAYGVKVAASTYFGKDLSRLEVHEAALLAALIKAPAFYDPRINKQEAIERRNYVIDRMLRLGMVEKRQARRAKAMPLRVVDIPDRPPTREPYFVEAVKREILDQKRLGRNTNERDRTLWEGGLKIETTLVPRLQAAAEAAVETTLDQPGDPAAALVAIRPRTGEIVAMVGGRDFRTSQVNLALGIEGGGAGRQPGSSFKPIVAATALEQGISLGSQYAAAPGIFTLADGTTWVVRNSEGTSGGYLPLNEAMVRSVNGVYARLALQLGAASIVQQAGLMGVQTKLDPYPPIALGAEEVSVLDMATAYATLANHGTAIEPTTIKRITTSQGEVIDPVQKVTPEAIAPGNAYLLTKVLEQVIQRGTGKAAAIGRPAAGKTGTTNQYSDAWFVGYTPQLAVAVWVGYPQGLIPMTNVHGIRVFGGTFPALIWKRFMTDAHRGLEVKRFGLPESDMITVLIDPVTGLLAAPWCPGEPVRILRQLAPKEYCPQPEPEPLPTFAPLTPSPTPTGKKATPEPEPTGKRNEPTPEPTQTKDEGGKPTPTPSG